MTGGSLTDSFQPMRKLLEQLIAIAPRVAMVLMVLVVGLILSALARRFTAWLVRRSGFETLAERIDVPKLLYAVGYKQSLAQMLGQIVWIAGLLFTFTAVAELMGLRAVAAASSAVVAYLPRVLAAAAILVAGLILASFLRNLLARVGRDREDFESPKLVGGIIYYAVVIVAATLALQQTGLETGLINSLIKITIGIAGLSVGLAFGLAARTAFQNVIARHYCERVIRPGDTLRFDEREGIVLGFTPVSAVLRTERGERLIPCRLLLEREVELEHLPRAKAKGEGDGGPRSGAVGEAAVKPAPDPRP